ncbi:hypothetical protein PLIP_a3160 [Pseudoalteromonas lipolytica LMEB 39]|nr:hypothetical protein [Pseudoalteromonas lipolytica LMEB 39]
MSIDDTNFQQFEVKNLAKLLGVDYELIKSEHSADVSSSVDITLSLISIFTSGELAKVRLKYQEDNEISYVDLTEGEQFYSYQITQIHSSSVVLKNQEQTISLKMFKPHLVTITKQNNEEDVTQ